VLDVLVPEVSLQGPGIVPLVRQSEAAGMAQHMRMGLETQLSGRAGAFHHAGKAGGGERRAALGREDERRPRILLPDETAKFAQLVTPDGMRARRPFLRPANGPRRPLQSQPDSNADPPVRWS